MNKRTFLIAVAVVVACAMAGAGTMAYFTSQATSENNAFVTGTLILGGVIDGEDVAETFENVAIGNLRPGVPAVVGTTILKNVGTLPFKLYRITADDFQLDDNVNGVTWDELDDLLALTVEINGEHVYTGKFSQLVLENGGFFDPIYDIFPDEELDMTLSVLMDSSAGNRYQGLRFTCDFTVYAAQNNMPNPGEPEGTVVDLGSSGGNPSFSVKGYNDDTYVNFKYNWIPDDLAMEKYIISIKHETGDTTTTIKETRIVILINEKVISTDGIDEDDVKVDWIHNIVKIKRSAFPAEWHGFEVKFEGEWSVLVPVYTGVIPYQYWSLEDEVHTTIWE